MMAQRLVLRVVAVSDSGTRFDKDRWLKALKTKRNCGGP